MSRIGKAPVTVPSGVRVRSEVRLATTSSAGHGSDPRRVYFPGARTHLHTKTAPGWVFACMLSG